MTTRTDARTVQGSRIRDATSPFLILSLAVLAAPSCAGRTDLTPAPSASTTRSAETAVTKVDGVRVKVQTDAWTGRRMVTHHVAPVRVTITNDSDKAITLQYSDFCLLGLDGRRYAALPPWQVKGTVKAPVLADGYAPITTPAFYSDGFVVAPYYAPLYPTLTAYPDYYAYDPIYYHHYYSYWADIPLPTKEMLDEALPEGVIDPGGRVTGFLYFERVGGPRDLVYFRGDLIQAKTGDRFGEIRIPLTVDWDVIG